MSFRANTIIIFCITITLFSSCDRSTPNSAEVLLFNGTGTSPNDVAAFKDILQSNSIDYETIDTHELNSITQEELIRYRLLIIPGGNFIEMGSGLTPSAANTIRTAVAHGMNYFGVCAGAFLAGKSEAYNGFDLTEGKTFHFYSLAEQNIRKSAVAITSADSSILDQYWEDGPQLAGWGNVVAKYPDNVPAVSEGMCGKGFVVLTGIHAEAPAFWRDGLLFNTPVEADHNYVTKLIVAALEGKPMAHF